MSFGIERVVVVAQPVLVGEEGFSGILRPHEAYLDTVGVAEFVAHRVAVLIAQVHFLVAASLIEGHTGGEHDVVVAVFQDALHGERVFLGHFAELYEIGEQAAGGVVDGLYPGQFADRLHGAVLVDVGLDVFHLLLIEEGQAEQVFARGGIDVQRLFLQVAEHLIGVFPVGRLNVLEGAQLAEVELPWPFGLGMQTAGKAQHECSSEQVSESFHGSGV